MAKKETPLMTQYNTIKQKYPDALLLFRVGDFYETFGADAVKTSQILGIVLTKRANGEGHIELAGFPHHSIDSYLPKLVRAGLRVAICDQLEDPKTVQGIVKRGVTELVTPGVMNRFWHQKRIIFYSPSIAKKKNSEWHWWMFLLANFWFLKVIWRSFFTSFMLSIPVRLFINVLQNYPLS